MMSTPRLLCCLAVLTVPATALPHLRAADAPIPETAVAGADLQAGFVLPEVKPAVIPDMSVRLTDFGGVADGRTLNTAAFAAAIERVAAQGGGRVVVPPGEWLTGPIVLRSKLALHLERGAVIRFSENRDDYPLVESSYEGRTAWRCQAPLSGAGLEDVAITGEGTIDGSGQVWRPVKKSKQTPGQWAALVASGGVLNAAGNIWYPSAGSREGNETPAPRLTEDPGRRAAIKDALRPVLLALRDCRRVLLEGVTFQNSPSWCLHPLMCEDVTVRGVTVKNPWYAQNGDGLDLDSCRNVLVEDSTFDVGDDAICLKSGRDAEGRARRRPTEYVTVRGCRVLHGHGGFVIGSEMSSGVRHVRVNDCVFTGTDVGLRFKSTRGRGGVVEQILVERVRMEKIARDAITFDLFYGGAAPTEAGSADGQAGAGAAVPRADETTPAFRNIVLRDISCAGAGRAALLQGLPEMPLENIRLERCRLVAETGILLADAARISLIGVHLEIQKGVPLQLRQARTVRMQDLTTAGAGGPIVHLSGARTAGILLPRALPESSVTRSADVPPDAVQRQ